MIAHHFTLDIQDSGERLSKDSCKGDKNNNRKKVKPGEVVAEGLGVLGELHCVSCPMGPDQVELIRNQVRSWF